MSGKGSRPRPYSVDQKTFDANWDAIFRKPDPRVIEDAIIEDEAWKALEERNKLNTPKDSNQGG